MMMWHTADSWLQPAERSGAKFGFVQLAGGIAAPLFLFVSGVTLGWRVSFGVPPLRGVRRGGIVIALGYALSLLMWWMEGRPRGFAFRGDALHVIGASMVLGSLLVHVHHRIAKSQRALGWTFFAVGGVILVITPWLERTVSMASTGGLAAHLAGWVVDTSSRHVARFPLFPWSAYAVWGIAIGVFWARAEERTPLGLVVIAWSVGGAAVAIVTSLAFDPAAALVHRIPDLAAAQATLYRLGISLTLAGLVVTAQGATLIRDSIQALGRVSLWAYCVHLPLVFGWPSAALRAAVDFSAWSLFWFVGGSAVLAVAYGYRRFCAARS